MDLGTIADGHKIHAGRKKQTGIDWLRGERTDNRHNWWYTKFNMYLCPDDNFPDILKMHVAEQREAKEVATLLKKNAKSSASLRVVQPQPLQPYTVQEVLDKLKAAAPEWDWLNPTTKAMP